MRILVLSVSALLLCAPSIAAQMVVLNEIHLDPIAPGLNDEFVELHNVSASAIDLGGWQLSDGIRYTFPEDLAPLEADGYLVVALDPRSTRFEGTRVLGPWEGRLDSEDDRIVLRAPNGEAIDEVDYAVRFPWPIAPAGDGPSMELLNPSLDNDLGSSWRPSEGEPTPGARNSVFVENAPPNIRQVRLSPEQPKPGEDLTIDVKITDADGVGPVVLHYQLVEPGAYIPAYQPWSRSALVAEPEKPRRHHADYAESLFTGRWPTVPMQAMDPEGNDDDPDNDARYRSTLPGQGNRVLLRYYITAEDAQGELVRAPLPDDPSLNFATFIYSGVPDWQAGTDSVLGNGHVYGQDVLQSLPVYHLLTRNEDWTECLAYNGSDQHPRSAMSARRAYNWSGTIIYDGHVYDNIAYRLRGGNGRYHLSGKRSMKFKFNQGHYFRAKNNRGEPYETTWRILTTSKMYGNRLTGTFGTRQGPGNFGLVDTVNGQMWELFGVPAVRTHWFHFRVIDAVEEAPDPYGGDFYGLNLAMERIDRRFLDSRGLPKGNLYKLTDQSENIDGVGGKGSASDGKVQQRYQAPNAPQQAEDYVNIFTQLRASQDEVWLRQHVQWDNWYRYTAVEEAIRHYDYWPDADKNMVQYFQPDPENPLGIYWQLPYDSDASWGPSWNEGIDYAQNAIERKEPFQIELRNTIREFRDLVWQPEVIGHLIDDAAAVIEPFHPADWDRWRNAPAASGSEDFGTLASKVADMKQFAFVGGLNYPGGNVSVGGRAAHLDRLMDDSAIPKTPTISFSEGAHAAVDAIRFTSSAYRVGSIFVPSQLGTVEWRLAEVTDPEAPAYDPEAARHYEVTALWEGTTGETLSHTVATDLLRVGHAYRARVRHRDVDNRVSHWSEPLHFIAEAPSAGATLANQLVLTEIMYHPAAPTESEAAAGHEEGDFEYLELWNRGAAALDLSDVRFTKGIDFNFPDGTLLASGAYGLVVANREAMAVRYGAGLPILGVWESDFSLANGGERLKLSFGAGFPLIDFIYDDTAPWTTAADGTGPSLILAGIASGSISYDDAGNWQASEGLGSPGESDASIPPGNAEQAYRAWLTTHGLTDTSSAFARYAMAADVLGVAALPHIDANLRLIVHQRASGIASAVESSPDLLTWTTQDLVPDTQPADPQGTTTLTFSLKQEHTRYWRVRFLLED